MKTTQPIALKQAPWLEGVRPLDAIRLHPRRATQPLDPGSSKMGWPFLWPAAEPWPVCNQRDPGMAASFEAMIERAERLGLQIDSLDFGPQSHREQMRTLTDRFRDGHNASYLPVLQLTRPEFPQLPFPGDADVFQLFWCPMVHFGGTGGWLIFWHRADAIGELRADPPPPATDGYEIAPCTLDPERIHDYPQALELGSLPDSEEDFEAMEDLGPAPGTKLFGFPKWVQSPDYPSCGRCRKQMDLLLTISSTEFGHGRNETRWVPHEEHEIVRGAPFRAREEYVLPHGWMIGDVGDAYLFYCRTCRGEFDSCVQSS